MVSVAGLWTAALYLGLGAGLLALFHRFLAPLSWRAGAALWLLPLCFTGGALLAGDSYGGAALAYGSEPLAAHRAEHGMEGPHDPALQDLAGVVIPWRAATRYALGHGDWPLWNPFAGCGEPLAGSAQPAPFSLIELVSLAAPLPQSFTLSVSLVFLVAAAGTFLLAGELGCRPLAAFFAAAGFAFCNFLVFWNGWPLGPTVAWLPVAVLAGFRLIARPGPGSAALLAVVLAQVLLSGHPESALHVVVLAGLAGAVELLVAARAGRVLRVGPVLGWAGAGGALALGLAAVFLLPVADALLQSDEWSARAATRDVIHGTDWRYTRGALLVDLAHFAYGLPGRGESHALPPWLIPASSLYAGSVMFPLALFGLVRSRSPRRLLLAGLLVFGLLAGAKMPGFFPLLGHLPLFEMSLNERLVFVASFALALLGALGVEAALARGEARRLGAWMLATLAGYGALFAWLLPRIVEQGVARDVAAAQASAAALPLALGAALLLARRPRAPFALLALLGVVLAARVVEAGWMYDRTPERAFYPRVPPLDRLTPVERQEEPFRVVGWGPTLIPNAATLYRLEDVRTYNALHLKRFAQTWPLWTERELGFWFLRVDQVRNPFLDFLNATYLLAPRDLPRERPWAREGGGVHVRLLRNRRALPRAFLPAQVLPAPGGAHTIAAMREETDFGARAWIEHPSVPPGGLDNAGGAVRARRRGTGYRLEVALEREAWIVVSETAWRGWRARAGGEALQLGFANHAFLAVRAPAGSYGIDLFYRPRSFEVGATLSAAALAVLLRLALRQRRRQLGEPPSPAPGRAAAAEAAAAS
jgi:hypothetical protein